MDAGSYAGIRILTTGIPCVRRIIRTVIQIIRFYRKRIMTVKELIDMLSHVNPDRLVVMSKDGEGNSFSPLDEGEVGVYEPESTWAGNFFEEATLGEEDYSQPGEEAVLAICLWPTN